MCSINWYPLIAKKLKWIFFSVWNSRLIFGGDFVFIFWDSTEDGPLRSQSNTPTANGRLPEDVNTFGKSRRRRRRADGPVCFMHISVVAVCARACARVWCIVNQRSICFSCSLSGLHNRWFALGLSSHHHRDGTYGRRGLIECEARRCFTSQITALPLRKRCFGVAFYRRFF